MFFKDIIGQDKIKRMLTNSVAQGRISHAQLFAGGEGVGALSLAIAYIQYINCPHKSATDSCGECPSCRQIAELAHPDVHFVFPVNTPKGKSSSEKPVSDQFIGKWRELVKKTGGYFNEQMWYSTIDIENKQGNISKSEADEIIRKLSFKSFESPYKAIIIWLPEKMNVQAANTLLKILEEPWDKTLFLLVSESPDKLLPTILSRTQIIDIPGIEDKVLASYLSEKHNIPIEDALKMARLSRGNILEAERNIFSGEEHDMMFEYFVQLMRLSYENKHMELLEWAENAASLGREEQKRLIKNHIRLIRESYMLTAGMGEISYLVGKEYDFCKKFAPYVNNNNVEALVNEMETVIRQISQNGNAKIIFTHFALSVSKLINKL